MAQWTCEDCKNLIESEHRRNFYGDVEYKCKKGGWTTKNHRIESYECQNGYHAPDLKPHDVGCYITTLVVNRLGLSDNSLELNTLRKLRSIMQENMLYKDMLLDYDTVGPTLAKVVNKMDIKDVLTLKKIYIDGSVKYTLKGFEYLDKGNKELSDLYFKKAIILYKEMTDNLKKKYITNSIVGDTIKNDYDITSGGHGRLIKKIH